MKVRLMFALALCLGVAVPAMAQYRTEPAAGTGAMPGTAMAAGMPSEGVFQTYIPATGTSPAYVVVQQDWNGTPVTVTYRVSSRDRWMMNGRQVNWSRVQAGTTLMIPSSAQVWSATYGGPLGQGTITAIDPTTNTLTVRLPTGEMRTVRYSPNAVFISEGRAVPWSSLAVGNTVVFELPSGQNAVGIVTATQPGVQGTIIDVGDSGIKVSLMENGKESTRVYSVNDTRFFRQGQAVTAANLSGTFQTGDRVWVSGSPDHPQFVASGVTEGFEAAVIQPGTMEQPTTMVMAPTWSQGTFMGYRPATATSPGTVTLRHDWNGTPVTTTYRVTAQDRWAMNGQPINWSQVQMGSSIPIPQNAQLWDVTFGGPVGVGTITEVDRVRNTMSVRLPSGEIRTIRYSPNVMFFRGGRSVPLTGLAAGATVMFELPPDQNQVGIITAIQPGVQGTITQVAGNTITVRTMQNGAEVTRNYAVGGDTRFVDAGESVLTENLPGTYQVGENVWVYGPLDSPQLIASNVTQGFEAAMTEPGMMEQPTTTAEQPTTTAEQPEVATTTTEQPFVSMAAPFQQGRLVSYMPATESQPAMATVSFNWNGTPMLATFAVSDQDRWMSNGMAADFAMLQPGAMISVPQTAQFQRVTFGGPMSVGTITNINRTRNLVTLRLPSGQMTTVRYSPQAIVIRDNAPVMLSDLNTGDTVMFEVAPGRNQVALFQPVAPGTQGTITAVTDQDITVQFMRDGEMVTETFPRQGNVMFLNRGQPVTVTTWQTVYRPGSTVWIYGPTEQPTMITSAQMGGFETAVVQPTPVTTRPRPEVLGTRQAPVIRGRW